jgi:hypothetical protein
VLDSVVEVLALGLAPVEVFVVSDFCSHAARRAAPARMQMYFFISSDRAGNIEFNDESEQARFSVLPKI